MASLPVYVVNHARICCERNGSIILFPQRESKLKPEAQVLNRSIAGDWASAMALFPSNAVFPAVEWLLALEGRQFAPLSDDFGSRIPLGAIVQSRNQSSGPAWYRMVSLVYRRDTVSKTRVVCGRLIDLELQRLSAGMVGLPVGSARALVTDGSRVWSAWIHGDGGPGRCPLQRGCAATNPFSKASLIATKESTVSLLNAPLWISELCGSPLAETESTDLLPRIEITNTRQLGITRDICFSFARPSQSIVCALLCRDGPHPLSVANAAVTEVSACEAIINAAISGLGCIKVAPPTTSDAGTVPAGDILIVMPRKFHCRHAGISLMLRDTVDELNGAPEDLKAGVGGLSVVPIAIKAGALRVNALKADRARLAGGGKPGGDKPGGGGPFISVPSPANPAQSGWCEHCERRVPDVLQHVMASRSHSEAVMGAPVGGSCNTATSLISVSEVAVLSMLRHVASRVLPIATQSGTAATTLSALHELEGQLDTNPAPSFRATEQLLRQKRQAASIIQRLWVRALRDVACTSARQPPASHAVQLGSDEKAVVDLALADATSYKSVSAVRASVPLRGVQVISGASTTGSARAKSIAAAAMGGVPPNSAKPQKTEIGAIFESCEWVKRRRVGAEVVGAIRGFRVAGSGKLSAAENAAGDADSTCFRLVPACDDREAESLVSQALSLGRTHAQSQSGVSLGVATLAPARHQRLQSAVIIKAHVPVIAGKPIDEDRPPARPFGVAMAKAGSKPVYTSVASSRSNSGSVLLPMPSIVALLRTWSFAHKIYEPASLPQITRLWRDGITRTFFRSPVIALTRAAAPNDRYSLSDELERWRVLATTAIAHRLGLWDQCIAEMSASNATQRAPATSACNTGFLSFSCCHELVDHFHRRMPKEKGVHATATRACNAAWLLRAFERQLHTKGGASEDALKAILARASSSGIPLIDALLPLMSTAAPPIREPISSLPLWDSIPASPPLRLGSASCPAPSALEFSALKACVDAAALLQRVVFQPPRGGSERRDDSAYLLRGETTAALLQRGERRDDSSEPHTQLLPARACALCDRWERWTRKLTSPAEELPAAAASPLTTLDNGLPVGPNRAGRPASSTSPLHPHGRPASSLSMHIAADGFVVVQTEFRSHVPTGSSRSSVVRDSETAYADTGAFAANALGSFPGLRPAWRVARDFCASRGMRDMPPAETAEAAAAVSSLTTNIDAATSVAACHLTQQQLAPTTGHLTRSALNIFSGRHPMHAAIEKTEANAEASAYIVLTDLLRLHPANDPSLSNPAEGSQRITSVGFSSAGTRGETLLSFRPGTLIRAWELPGHPAVTSGFVVPEPGWDRQQRGCPELLQSVESLRDEGAE